MSVLIKDMEMPSGCPFCPMAYWESSRFYGCTVVVGKERAVLTDKEYAESPAASRPDWCPLIPVPPHGRAIDADALFKEIGMGGRFGILEAMCIQSIIHDAPTIIPADKEEQT